MASDDDGEILSDEQTESFLTNSESISGLSFPTASGIKVGRLGKTIVGSIAFAIGIAFNTTIAAVVTAFTGLIDGFREFIVGGTRYVRYGFTGGGYTVETDGLIDVTVGAGVAALEGAWSFSVDQFGIFALLVGVVAILATAYVASRGLEAASGVLR